MCSVDQPEEKQFTIGVYNLTDYEKLLQQLNADNRKHSMEHLQISKEIPLK